MENNIKEIMYRVLHVIAVYIMGIDSFQLAISLHICLEKYAMYTEQINGENISVDIVVNGRSLFGDFVILLRFKFHNN